MRNAGPTLLQGECGETKTTNKVKQPWYWNLIHQIAFDNVKSTSKRGSAGLSKLFEAL
jgi:hypothetical protein